jgi:hypothetical protein
MAAADLSQVGVAESEEPIQCLGIELSREPLQPLAHGVPQESDRDPTTMPSTNALAHWLMALGF